MKSRYSLFVSFSAIFSASVLLCPKFFQGLWCTLPFILFSFRKFVIISIVLSVDPVSIIIISSTYSFMFVSILVITFDSFFTMLTRHILFVLFIFLFLCCLFIISFSVFYYFF